MRKAFLAALVVALTVALMPFVAASAQGQPIIFGIIGSTTSSTFRGVRLALEQVNQRGGALLPNGQRVGVSPAVAEVRTPEEVIAAISSLEQVGVAAIFGPDDPDFARVIANRTPNGVPLFTAATNSEVPIGLISNSLRSRASDSARMAALADVLVSNFNARRITLYQGTSAGASSAATALVVALAQRQVAATPILQDPNASVAAAAEVVLQTQPDTVVAFGKVDELLELYQALREANFNGRFVTDQADNRAFINGLGPTPLAGMIGVTNWLVTDSAPASAAFVRAYLEAFGEAPDGLAAAAYDAANAVLAAIQRVGTQPAQLYSALLSLPAQPSLQGMFDPSIGGGETTQNAVIFETNATGGGKLFARYKAGQRLPDVPEQVFQPTLIAPPIGQPTLPPPPPPPFGQPTLPPIVVTATPAFVELTVLNDFVNVRYGPGPEYAPPIGRLPRGTKVELLGANSTYTWFTFNFQGQLAWVTGDSRLVSIFGDVRILPIVPAPPTRTPAATATPTLSPFPDLVVVSAFLSQNPLFQGVPFSLTVTVRNQGGANAGPFAVAASFRNVYGAVNVPGLASQQQVTVVINYPGVPGPSGIFKDAVVLDLNNEVNEGPNGEANNLFEITYNVQ
ncbi:MAG: ABC transporter substrate-binding protein [Anaerolineae bacterium]|nr:ABC transporter substrate-binding protein [Anaerolineae bacterium]